MSALLAQNGFTALALVACLFLAGVGYLVYSLQIREDVQIAAALIAMCIFGYMIVVLLLDRFTALTSIRKLSFLANFTPCVLLLLAVLASFGLFIWVARSHWTNRWLQATTVLLGVPVFGFVAAEMWLYADAYHTHPAIDYLARIASVACLVLLLLLTLAIAGLAYRREEGAKSGGG